MKLNTYRRTSAFTLVEIMIVVAIIGLLAAIAIPNFVRARETSQTQACINNLRQIDAAIQQWALENNQGPNATVTHGDVVGYLKSPPRCPAGGTGFESDYSLTTVSNAPTCTVQPGTHVLP